MQDFQKNLNTSTGAFIIPYNIISMRKGVLARYVIVKVDERHLLVGFVWKSHVHINYPGVHFINPKFRLPLLRISYRNVHFALKCTYMCCKLYGTANFNIQCIYFSIFLKWLGIFYFETNIPCSCAQFSNISLFLILLINLHISKICLEEMINHVSRSWLKL